MLSGPFLSRNWPGASEDFDKSKWIMVGLPYDGTCSYRPGTRFGPEMIRIAAWGLEDYSPYQNKELTEVAFYDAGELDLPLGNRDKCLNLINQATRETLDAGKQWLGIGGEHLVTYPAIQAYTEKYPDLAIIHFDAHADLREEYLGECLSHASVMRLVTNLIGAENLIQIGIRSGTKDEFDWMNEHKSLIKDRSEIPAILDKLSNRPVYLSIDLDVLDPGIMSGTGTPEAGGMSFNELISWLLSLSDLNIVGADVVELSPHYDPSGVSTITAAKVVREVLLLK
ncbi:MAG: agmatinase [Candidatus Melainabacteria bacterium GWF2_32_7]|nr:MAG: agmatinase [Candidatus Melainabacteria bacterium GWF2_32_7]